ncbi:3TM-type holin [Oceanicola sp. S124]|uniref:3TM-type holin n=1 Tax=Oceanicola sp. S124 TaxID=1042378 RepID=UPI000255826F|nr:3TM-type holin [Oceanicola sp. S124]
MGLMTSFFTMLFGGNRNVLREAAEVFVPNAESTAQRAADNTTSARSAYAAEQVRGAGGWFGSFVDALNRLPRPLLALGVIGLLVAAMVDPIWYAERMQGLALTPDALWQALGVIMLFFFGGRMQVKHGELKAQVEAMRSAVPQVIENVKALRALRHDSPGVAATAGDAELELRAVAAGPDQNAAVEDWRKQA